MSALNGMSLLLILIASAGYALATVGMKLGSATLSGLAILLIVAGMAGAAAAEIVILRHLDLGIVYLGILALETTIVLIIAALLGEGLSLRQLAGAGLVIAGIVLVTQGTAD